MLTGRPPFDGETIADNIAAIIEREPGLVARCLPIRRRTSSGCCRAVWQKNPRQRLRDIGDALAELESTAPASPASDARSSTRPAVQFRRLTDSGGANESPAISPDGKMVVFVAPHDGRRHLGS